MERDDTICVSPETVEAGNVLLMALKQYVPEEAMLSVIALMANVASTSFGDGFQSAINEFKLVAQKED